MGTDIHMYVEKKVKGKWVAADRFITEDPECGIDVARCYSIYHERNYTLFRVLAGVRTFPLPPDLWQKYPVKGFPDDASHNVRKVYERYDVDAHTPSYLTVKELRAVPWGMGGASIPIAFNVTAKQKELYDYFKNKYIEEKGKFVQGAVVAPKRYQVDMFVYDAIKEPWESYIYEILTREGKEETPLVKIYAWVPLNLALPDFDKVRSKLSDMCEAEHLKDDEIRIVYFFDN